MGDKCDKQAPDRRWDAYLTVLTFNSQQLLMPVLRVVDIQDAFAEVRGTSPVKKYKQRYLGVV